MSNTSINADKNNLVQVSESAENIFNYSLSMAEPTLWSCSFAFEECLKLNRTIDDSYSNSWLPTLAVLKASRFIDTLTIAVSHQYSPFRHSSTRNVPLSGGLRRSLHAAAATATAHFRWSLRCFEFQAFLKYLWVQSNCFRVKIQSKNICEYYIFQMQFLSICLMYRENYVELSHFHVSRSHHFRNNHNC